MTNAELKQGVYEYFLPIVATQCQVRNGTIEGSGYDLENVLKELQCHGLLDFDQEEKLLTVLSIKYTEVNREDKV